MMEEETNVAAEQDAKIRHGPISKLSSRGKHQPSFVEVQTSASLLSVHDRNAALEQDQHVECLRKLEYRIAWTHPVEHNRILMELNNIDEYCMNRLRRAVVFRVPTMAIHQVSFNSAHNCIQSNANFEMRLRQIPIKADARKFIYTYQDNFRSSPESTIIFELNVSHPAGADHPLRTVFSSELKSPSHPHIRPVYDTIPIVELVPGQCVAVTMLCVKNDADEVWRINWSPVALLGHRHYPRVTIVKPILDQAALQLVATCPRRVFDIEDVVIPNKMVSQSPFSLQSSGSASVSTIPTITSTSSTTIQKRARVVNARDCSMCTLCTRGDLPFINSIETTRESNRFLLPIRSNGQYTPLDVFQQALAICRAEDKAMIRLEQQQQEQRRHEKSLESKQDRVQLQVGNTLLHIPSDKELLERALQYRAIVKQVKNEIHGDTNVSKNERYDMKLDMDTNDTRIHNVDAYIGPWDTNSYAFIQHRLRITMEKISLDWYQDRFNIGKRLFSMAIATLAMHGTSLLSEASSVSSSLSLERVFKDDGDSGGGSTSSTSIGHQIETNISCDELTSFIVRQFVDLVLDDLKTVHQVSEHKIFPLDKALYTFHLKQTRTTLAKSTLLMPSIANVGLAKRCVAIISKRPRPKPSGYDAVDKGSSLLTQAVHSMESSAIQLEAERLLDKQNATIYNPTTGKPMDARVVEGFMAEKPLTKLGEHQVKSCARANDRSVVTRQPIKHVAIQGGSRAGRMELKAMDQNGSPVVTESVIKSADTVTMTICKICKSQATYQDAHTGECWCNSCKHGKGVVKYDIPYSFPLGGTLVSALGLHMVPQLGPNLPRLDESILQGRAAPVPPTAHSSSPSLDVSSSAKSMSIDTI